METYQPLYSTNIERADFDPDEGTLQVEFKDGSTYLYRGVTRQVFDGLQRARSAGEYFARQIKNVYNGEQV